MNKIFDKVNNCLEKFIGGEIFFDELDKQIKFDKQLLEELFYKAKNEKRKSLLVEKLVCVYTIMDFRLT